MDAIEARFKEYDTLRDEILQSITHRTQLISFGFGGLATLAAATVLVHEPEDPRIGQFVFAVIIPAGSLVMLLMWFSELLRMFTASSHLASLERRINGALEEKDVLTWESTDRSERRSRWYRLVILLFTFTGALAPIAGVAIADADWTELYAWVPQSVLALLVGARVWIWADDACDTREGA